MLLDEKQYDSLTISLFSEVIDNNEWLTIIFQDNNVNLFIKVVDGEINESEINNVNLIPYKSLIIEYLEKIIDECDNFHCIAYKGNNLIKLFSDFPLYNIGKEYNILSDIIQSEENLLKEWKKKLNKFDFKMEEVSDILPGIYIGTKTPPLHLSVRNFLSKTFPKEEFNIEAVIKGIKLFHILYEIKIAEYSHIGSQILKKEIDKTIKSMADEAIQNGKDIALEKYLPDINLYFQLIPYVDIIGVLAKSWGVKDLADLITTWEKELGDKFTLYKLETVGTEFANDYIETELVEETINFLSKGNNNLKNILNKKLEYLESIEKKIYKQSEERTT